MIDLFTYPDSPGFKDRDTGRQAADAIAGRAPILSRRCLALVKNCGTLGCTADEAANSMSESVLSIRPRFTELVQRGLIVDSGQRRKNRSGRNAKVMVATLAMVEPFRNLNLEGYANGRG